MEIEAICIDNVNNLPASNISNNDVLHCRQVSVLYSSFTSYPLTKEYFPLIQSQKVKKEAWTSVL